MFLFFVFNCFKDSVADCIGLILPAFFLFGGLVCLFVCFLFFWEQWLILFKINKNVWQLHFLLGSVLGKLYSITWLECVLKGFWKLQLGNLFTAFSENWAYIGSSPSSFYKYNGVCFARKSTRLDSGKIEMMPLCVRH